MVLDWASVLYEVRSEGLDLSEALPLTVLCWEMVVLLSNAMPTKVSLSVHCNLRLENRMSG